MPETITGLVSIAFIVIVAAVAFVLFRDLVLWYFKINERVENQRRIIRLLESIDRNAAADVTPAPGAPSAQSHSPVRH